MDADRIKAATKAAHDYLIAVKIVLLAVNMEDLSPAVSKLLEPLTINDGRTAEERHANVKTAMFVGAIKKLCETLDADGRKNIEDVKNRLICCTNGPVSIGGVTKPTAHEAACELAYALWRTVKNIMDERIILRGGDLSRQKSSCRLDETLLGDDRVIMLILHKLQAVIFDYPAAKAAVDMESVKAMGTLPAELLGDDPSTNTTSNTSSIPLDARALAVFIEHPEWTKKQIADYLICNAKSLAPARCPKLNAAIRAHKAQPSFGRHGTKDSEGNLEAWEE